MGEGMGEYGKEDNECFNGLFTFKTVRPHDEAADKTPAGPDDNEDGHEIHDPGVIKEEVRIFKTGETKSFGQNNEEEIKQDENEEPPSHKSMTQWSPVFRPEIFKLAKLAKYVGKGIGYPFAPALVSSLFFPQEHVL
jgi:hypothetical protein